MHPQILDIFGGDFLPFSIFKFIKMFFFAHSKIELNILCCKKVRRTQSNIKISVQILN